MIESNSELSASLYTRDGRPLRVSGRDVFDRTGRQVARRDADLLYGPDGRYAATVVGDRVVYRTGDRLSIRSGFLARTMAAISVANRPPVVLRGEEPFAPPAAPHQPTAAGETARSETPRSESGRSESGRSESGRSESGRSESGRSESGRSESGRSESGRSESVQRRWDEDEFAALVAELRRPQARRPIRPSPDGFGRASIR